MEELAEQSIPIEDDVIDALPMRIALLDEDGIILDTNQRWREFAEESGVDDPAMIGVDYCAVSEKGFDSKPDVVKGIESVLSARTDVYTFEYPCETPEEELWFLLRAAPFERDGSRYVAIAHIDITRRKREEKRLERLTSRIGGVLTEVGADMAAAETREDVFEELPKTLVKANPYIAAWTLRRDIQRESLVLEYVAGALDPQDIDEVSLEGSDSDRTAVRAFEMLKPVVIEPWNRQTGPRYVVGDTSDNAVDILLPIHYDGTRYGLLGVRVGAYALTPDLEKSTLSALACIAGQALHKINQQSMLHGTQEIVLEYMGLQNDPLVDFVQEHQGSLSFVDVLERNQDQELLLEIEGISPDTLREEAVRHPEINEVAVVGNSDPVVLKVSVEGSLLDELVRNPARLEEFTVQPNDSLLQVSVPSQERARALHDRLTEEYSNLELGRKCERKCIPQSRGTVADELSESLTERQSTALKVAHQGGFFEQPRRANGDQLADSMNITRQTFHQHLQSAQRKVFDAVIESGSVPVEGSFSD